MLRMLSLTSPEKSKVRSQLLSLERTHMKEVSNSARKELDKSKRLKEDVVEQFMYTTILKH